MNKKLKLILKDLAVNGISDSLGILAYFSMAEILKGETNILIAENALKLGVILFTASTASSLYKNLIGERIEDRTTYKFLAHLANLPLTDTVATLMVVLVMSLLPPQETVKEVEKSILSTPFFLTLVANYTGRGLAHVVNHVRDIQGIKKACISAASSIVPTIACNLLYFAKFGKNGNDAISEVSALTTASIVSNILNYSYEKWVKSKEEVNEITPLIG